MQNVIELNETEIFEVAGGPLPALLVLGAKVAAGVGAVAVAANAAKDIIEVGEKIHDAVCDH